ncbi:uncharacterized protein METZ01_LOCUS479009 [marine metagenome]|uniref:Uncharacterized protein n=1 Tax=marine metagenome TaxID=408172 RepID=A0A383C3I6_9ZZZZ
MSIDLDSTEGRKQYLSEKLDDLLDGINDSYGTILMEELLSRLELTVKDFNDEMKTLCGQLVKQEQERQQLLEMLKSSSDIPAPPSGALPVDGTEGLSDASLIETDEPEEDIPEWEKKLEKLEKK